MREMAEILDWPRSKVRRHMSAWPGVRKASGRWLFDAELIVLHLHMERELEDLATAILATTGGGDDG